MEHETALLSLRIGGWANIAIGIGHVLSMARMRETLQWVGGPDFDRLYGLHPTLPYLVGQYGTLGPANDVAVSEGVAYLVTGDGNLIALRYDGVV